MPRTIRRLMQWQAAYSAAGPMVAASLVSAALGLVGVAPALATDGVIEINRAKVMARGGFPFQINQSGSYRLTSNLVVSNANTTAISVNASDVTIDLNGFSIIGPGTCPTTGPNPVGIDSASRHLITIYNGEVAGMGGHGIIVDESGRIERVRVLGNCGEGIICGDGCDIAHNVSANNQGSGILLQSGRVSSNVTQFNRVDGIDLESDAGSGALVSGNTVNHNGFAGIVSAVSGSGMIRGNAVSDNPYGLRCASGAAGYANNVFSSNSDGNVIAVGGSCVNLGENLCDGSLCP